MDQGLMSREGVVLLGAFATLIAAVVAAVSSYVTTKVRLVGEARLAAEKARREYRQAQWEPYIKWLHELTAWTTQVTMRADILSDNPVNLKGKTELIATAAWVVTWREKHSWNHPSWVAVVGNRETGKELGLLWSAVDLGIGDIVRMTPKLAEKADSTREDWQALSERAVNLGTNSIALIMACEKHMFG